MTDAYNMVCGYGEQVEIFNEAKKRNCNVKFTEKDYYDNFFIQNNMENPISINGEVYRYIYMSAKEQDSFHNIMFILATNNKREIENYVNT